MSASRMAVVRARPQSDGRRLSMLPASMGRRAVGQAAPAPAPMTLPEAVSMLPGLKNAVEKAEAALRSGARCPDVTAADLDVARIFRDKMAQFVANGVQNPFMVEKAWLDAADKAVRCAIQAEQSAPNTGAYVALGAVLVGAIVALSV